MIENHLVLYEIFNCQHASKLLSTFLRDDLELTEKDDEDLAKLLMHLLVSEER